jgi:O-antigen/teichoic acid export membrane protein
LANLKKNLAYNFLLSCSQVLLPIISIPYLSRVLTPEGIGKVSFIDSFTYYFIAIAEFGIVVYGIREAARVKEDKEQLKKLVSELLSLHIITSAITLALYSLSVLFVWKHIQDTRLLVLSFTFLLFNFLSSEWYFIGTERFKYIALRSLAIRIAGLAAMFIFIKGPEDYYIYYGIIVASAIIAFLWNITYLLKEVPVSFRGINFKRHLKYTQIIYFISLTYDITLLLDNVYLRLMSTAAAVGYYAFSMKMVRISTSLITDSLLVFFPRIVSSLNDSKGGHQHVLNRNLQLLLAIGLFLTADQLVLVFLGEQFRPAINDLKILAVFPCIKAYNLFLGNQVLIAWNKEKIYLRSLLVSGLVFTVLALVLSYYFADRGACAALLIAELVTFVMNLYYVKRLVKEIKIFDQWNFFSAAAISCLFIPVIYFIKKINTPLITQLSISVVACLVVYILVQLYVARNTIPLIVKAWITSALFRKSTTTDKHEL